MQHIQATPPMFANHRNTVTKRLNAQITIRKSMVQSRNRKPMDPTYCSLDLDPRFRTTLPLPKIILQMWCSQNESHSDRVCIVLPLKQEVQFGTEYYSLNNIGSILHFFWIIKGHARMSTSVIVCIATPNQQFRTEGALIFKALR